MLAAILSLHFIAPAFAPVLTPTDEGRALVESNDGPWSANASAQQAEQSAARSRDPRAFLLGYAHAAFLAGWDRDAIIALQSLRGREPIENGASAAMWQLAIVQMATRIGEHRQVVGQLQKLEREIDALHARDDPRADEVASFTERFVLAYVARRYIGAGCTRSGMGFFVPDNDDMPRLLAKLASDHETRALALFVLGEMWVHHDEVEAATYYRGAIEAAPSSLWAEKATRCITADEGVRACGGDGADGATSNEPSREELAALFFAR